MVHVPEGLDPVAKQRWQWGRNIQDQMDLLDWERKRVLFELDEQYGVKASPQAMAQWLSGQVSPRPDVQSALAALFGMVHHLLFPPIPAAEVREWNKGRGE